MKFEAKPWQKTLYIRTGPHLMFVETPWTLQGCPFLFEHWRSTSSKLWSPWHPMVSNGPMVQWMDNNQITSHIQWRKGSHGISVGFSVKWINNYTELAKILAIEFGEEVTQISTNISKIPYTKKDTKWRVMHFRWLSSIIEYKYIYLYNIYILYIYTVCTIYTYIHYRKQHIPNKRNETLHKNGSEKNEYIGYAFKPSEGLPPLQDSSFLARHPWHTTSGFLSERPARYWAQPHIKSAVLLGSLYSICPRWTTSVVFFQISGQFYSGNEK